MVTYYAAQLCIALSVVNSYVIHSPTTTRGAVAKDDQKNRTFRLNGTCGEGATEGTECRAKYTSEKSKLNGT